MVTRKDRGENRPCTGRTGVRGVVLLAVPLLGFSSGAGLALPPDPQRPFTATTCEAAKVDAGTLASLHAAGYLPEIWTPDAATERMRRLVARRYQVVRC